MAEQSDATEKPPFGTTALEGSVLEAIESSPVPVKIYRRDATVVLENERFREWLRTARPGLRALVDGSHAGGPSALQAALAGHSRAVPLGAADGVRVVALYAPLRTEGQDEVAHVSVSYVATTTATEVVAHAEGAEHGVPTLYPTEQSTVFETQLRFIVDNIPELIWSTLPDGYVDFYNRRWDEYIGASLEQMQGAGWNDFLHPEDQQRTWERFNHSLASGEPVEVEYRLRRHDGEYRWFLARGLPMRDASGRIVRWLGSLTDIDDQKKVEKQREEALAELERATRLKDEFLANASHELRTPLTAICGWAHLQRVRPELAPRAMEVIERNANALSYLINDLLDMSRIVTNKVSLEPEPIELLPLVQSAVDVVRPATEAKQLSLRLKMDERVGVIVADPNRLRQVISNIISNAVKFTPRGGAITLVTERRGSQAVVEVTDTGKGISPDFLPYVFDRFRQADGSPTRREGGLGLGLSIAKHLVELHGGALHAHSEGVGRGATFTMMLPLPAVCVTSVGSSTAADRATASRLDGVHALIVDDDRDARELLTLVLKNAGATTDDVDSASAALAAIRARSPDIVLSDIGMPERSGYDLIGELRAQGFQRPVVALTAFAGSEDRARALTSGFDDHIAKPVRLELLVSAIARLVLPREERRGEEDAESGGRPTRTEPTDARGVK